MMCLQGLFGRASSSSSPSPLSPASASASTSASSSAPTKNPSSIAAAAEAKKSSVGYSLQTPPSSSSGNSSKGNGHLKAPNKSVPAAASDNSNPASGLPAGKQSVHSAAQLSAPTGDKAATPPSARSTVMQGLKPLLKPKAKAKPSPPLSLQYNFDASASTSISLPRRPAVDPSFSAPTPPASDTDSNMAGAGVRKKPAKKGISKSAANAAAGYYTGGSAGVPAAAAPGAGSEGKLDKMFDSLKGDSDEKDVMAIDSTMAYLTDTLSFNPDGVEIFVALEIVQAPGLGEITRKGFVEGWRDAGGHSSKTAQIQYIKQKTAKLGSDPAYFKQVYRHSFLVGKETHQKAVALDVAKEFWRPLLTVGRPWKTASHDWLELWLEFLGEKWTRSVNRDMWYQLLEFANKTLEDETLGFWSEDGAWPSVIDDFVVWCRDTHNIQPSQEVEMKD